MTAVMSQSSQHKLSIVDKSVIPGETFVGQSETMRTDGVHQAHVWLRIGINHKASQISYCTVYREYSDITPEIE